MRLPPKHTIDYYLLPNKICCDIIGMWPSEGKRSTYGKMFAYFRLSFTLIAVISVFVPQIMLLAVNWGDVKILIGAGCVFMTVAQFLFKTFYIIARRERWYRLYKELRSLWDSTDISKERQSYEEFAYWARASTTTFCLSAGVTATVFTVTAIVDNIRAQRDSDNHIKRQFVFELWYGTDVDESPRFEIAFVCQVVSLYIGALAITALDSMCVTFILHVSGQFRLINVWVGNIGIKINCGSVHYATDYMRNVAADLVRCICHHQRIIHVVDDVNNLLAPIIFIQLLTSSIEVCLSGYAVMSSDSNNSLFNSIAYLVSMMMQLLLWCWPCEILIKESQGVGHAAYLDVPWYKLPLIYRKLLLLIIVKSQRYCSISALTLQTISIHTLTNVFNTAASYFTLLRQMEEGQQD